MNLVVIRLLVWNSQPVFQNWGFFNDGNYATLPILGLQQLGFGMPIDFFVTIFSVVLSLLLHSSLLSFDAYLEFSSIDDCRLMSTRETRHH
jgi:hypothetical protein